MFYFICSRNLFIVLQLGGRGEGEGGKWGNNFRNKKRNKEGPSVGAITNRGPLKDVN